jgi:iron(III) transport system permease protein
MLPRHLDAGAAGAVLACAIVLFFVGYPLIWLFGGPSFEAGMPKFDYLVSVLTSGRTASALWNSFVASAGAMAFSVLMGVPIAFFCARTDMPLRGLVKVLVVASFITPSFLLAFAYVLLMGPNAGVINKWIAALFGTQQGPFDIFSMWGLIYIAALEGAPLVFMATAVALENMDGNLESAARMLGARTGKVLRSVSLPLVLPAIGAGALLAFISTLSLYGAPSILNVRVVPTEIRSAFGGSPPRFDTAAGLAVYLMALSLIGFFAYRRMMSGQQSYVTVTGKWAPAETICLGPWKWLALGMSALFVLLAVALPYYMLGLASFTHAFGQGFAPGNLTLDNYAYVVNDQFSLRSIWNSLLLALGAAIVGVVVGVVVAFIEVRGQDLPGRRFVEYMAMLPFGIPSIVLAVGLILAFIRPPLALYGTMWILLIAYTVKFMPLAIRTIAATLQQVDLTLEEASRMVGATRARTFVKITLPLVLPAALGGGFLIFIPSFRELGASVLLSAPGTEVVAFVMMTSWGSVSFEVVCTLGIITLAITVGVFYLFQSPLAKGAR